MSVGTAARLGLILESAPQITTWDKNTPLNK